jgi:Fe-S-cluster containining protein
VTSHSFVRPVVRSFTAQRLREAAAHVRGGGHAVVWESPSRARLLLPVPKEEDPADLALFSVLDLGKQRYDIVERGVARGLATTMVPRDCNDIVRRRAERDSVHSGSVRQLELDCIACGACCTKNRVELDERDQERFRAAGRDDLLRMPYARRSDGKLVMRLDGDGRCQHLQSGNRCGIYEMRPTMCRDFPVASECCLSTREEELDIYDGARPLRVPDGDLD